MNKENGIDVTRRSFIKSSVAAGAVLGGLSSMNAVGEDKKTIKIALIGCGGRGNGAVGNCLAAGSMLGLSIKVVAAADVFADKVNSFGKKNGVPVEKCFAGFDAYKKVMATDADVVLLATAPAFRPLHLEAAINAGKNVFMEKPVAVDPVGARRIIAAGDKAIEKGLAIVAGTQRRHDAGYRRTQFAVENGAIGRIVGGQVSWCMGQLWYKTRNPGESDADYLTRNWVNFTEMSGDHIVEQHVHNIDVANWFIGRPPVMAIGFGGRARRITANQYDFFSVDFDYGDGCHIHSMSRQINGCYNRVGEFFIGTEGVANGNGGLKAKSGWQMEIPQYTEGNPYDLEHKDLLQSILDGKPLNEARQVAESTLAGIMGRIAAYTGELVRWSDLTKNTDSKWYNFACAPSAEDFESGNVVAPKEDVLAVPGKA